MTLDAADRSTMFEDSGGVLGVWGEFEDWGHLETPTAGIFSAPRIVATDRMFTTDAAGPLGGIPVDATLTVAGTAYLVRDFDREEQDGGIVQYLLADNT